MSQTPLEEVERLIALHGEQNRLLIENAIKFLDHSEEKWGIVIKREEHIFEIVKRVRRIKNFHPDFKQSS